jgi:formylmethanofuran dehydrogenase subunit A
MTLQTAPAFDEEVIPSIRDWFESSYTIQFRNYAISDEEVGSTTIEPVVDPHQAGL